MSDLGKIIRAGIDCLELGGGGSPEFYKQQIEIMSDRDRAIFANLLQTEMPELTEKFAKIKQFDAWWQSRLVEHLWQPKTEQQELIRLMMVGINDTNMTYARAERNLTGVLNKCLPNHDVEDGWVGEKKATFYILGDLEDARDGFLKIYPHSTWPQVDEDAMVDIRAAEAKEAEERAYWKRIFKGERVYMDMMQDATEPTHRLLRDLQAELDRVTHLVRDDNLSVKDLRAHVKPEQDALDDATRNTRPGLFAAEDWLKEQRRRLGAQEKPLEGPVWSG